MNVQELLNQLLQSGQELARKGVDLAGQHLQLPEPGPGLDRALTDLGKGAALGGLLALLVGTGMGRRLSGPLLKIGGIAAIGAVGYSAWKKWQAGQNDAPGELGKPVHELAGPEAEGRAANLVRAMIGAAKADGHLDEAERNLITERIASLELPDTERRLLLGELARELDVAAIAGLADSRSAAMEIYLTSLLVIDSENEQERQYMDQLAASLDLPWELVRQLEAEAAAD